MSDKTEAKDTRKKLSSDLNGWGLGLVIMGIAHFVLSSVLLAEWGVVLIVLGILCFAIKHRAMYILLGLGLMSIGVLNGFSGLETGNIFWAIFGGLQIHWGVQEIRKFKTYKTCERKTELAQHQPGVIAEEGQCL